MKNVGLSLLDTFATFAYSLTMTGRKSKYFIVKAAEFVVLGVETTFFTVTLANVA